MYMNIGKECYLTIEDLPSNAVKVSKTLHGTLNDLQKSHFILLKMQYVHWLWIRIRLLFLHWAIASHAILSAVFKNVGNYFFTPIVEMNLE